jgi:hypothetical protein
MKSRYVAIVLLLVIGHILTEAHTFIMWAYPDSVTHYVGDWFVKSDFRVDNLSILWYCKMVEDSFLLVVLLFSGACQSYTRNYKTYLEWQRYSMRLYVIWVIYFVYHCFDMCSFLYNYKTNYALYVVALGVSTSLSLLVGFYKIKIFLKE